MKNQLSREQGYAAYVLGVAVTQNPYQWDTDAFWNWNRGWEEAATIANQ
jgi:ribosome modulation factor